MGQHAKVCRCVEVRRESIRSTTDYVCTAALGAFLLVIVMAMELLSSTKSKKKRKPTPAPFPDAELENPR